MKKTLFCAVLVLFALSGVYANGEQEDPLAQYRNKVTLSGSLQFENGFPVLSAGGKTYALMLRGFMRETFALKPGLALGVEGYVSQHGPMFSRRMWNGDAPSSFPQDMIFVEKVTIDGKTFDLGSDWGRGPFGGGMYHRGRGGRGGCDWGDRDGFGRGDRR